MSSDDEDAQVGDDFQSQQQAALNQQTYEDQLDEKYTNFILHLENLNRRPLNRSTGRKFGPNSGSNRNPKEVRQSIIERFFSRWRSEVGQDVYPAMRLIIPDRDRERAIYGIKEKQLARYLVKLMKIDRNSDDGFNLLNWKLPGQNASAKNAGDFPGRCYEVLCKRARLIEPGNMTIEEVNKQLDKLSAEWKDEKQLPIMETFYKNMNAEELTWLIRIILKSMRIGATEKTILRVWHPDAEVLFNVSSSLRRVCWELYDPAVRLEKDERGVKLAECYQPQLAYQPNMSFTQMVASMKPTEDDVEFYIEEKLDGERMQLHLSSDPDDSSSVEFRFWSRKAKDYTYLYGKSFEDKEAALTKYIKDGFKDGVESAVLDGEMVTWNVEDDLMVAFGSLKTAANAQKSNAHHHERPFYRVFDILLLNGRDLTKYTLRDRRKALEATINNVHRRMEILPYTVGTSADDIERSLRDVVARASEGLVIKSPRSAYRLGERLQDWIKVKPEYMTEFGESLDCLIIGGYYGTGRRGGELSSFLCGLREDQRDKSKTTRFVSFFKFGGGMTADDFAKLRHNTDGKWHRYNPSHPPSEHIVLGGGEKQIEMPDMWIKAQDSIVVEVKAASVNASEDYAAGVTLRFPRFTRFRLDKDWETALSIEEFRNVKVKVEHELKENEKRKKMEINKRKQKTQRAPRKKQVVVAGYEDRDIDVAEHANSQGNVFRGLKFYVITESTKPEKRSKIELERMVKENGGLIVQSAEDKQQKQGSGPKTDVICVAERRTVKVASLEKHGDRTTVRPIWLFDCIKQGKVDFGKGLTEIVVPFELERHLFHAVEERKVAYEGHVDRYGDSFARDTTAEELRELMTGMGEVEVDYGSLDRRDMFDAGDCRGGMFADLVFWFNSGDSHGLANGQGEQDDDRPTEQNQRVAEAKITARFAGASLATDLEEHTVTHVIMKWDGDKQRVRRTISSWQELPRVVSLNWIEQCWTARTRLDEERFAAV